MLNGAEMRMRTPLVTVRIVGTVRGLYGGLFAELSGSKRPNGATVVAKSDDFLGFIIIVKLVQINHHGVFFDCIFCK